jgi:hypothetical protein
MASLSCSSTACQKYRYPCPNAPPVPPLSLDSLPGYQLIVPTTSGLLYWLLLFAQPINFKVFDLVWSESWHSRSIEHATLWPEDSFRILFAGALCKYTCPWNSRRQFAVLQAIQYCLQGPLNWSRPSLSSHLPRMSWKNPLKSEQKEEKSILNP